MMDLYGSETMETSRKPSNNSLYENILKKTFQFLVPLSLMSFLLYYNFQFSSALVFPLFSHALERKYMFLICNGILAFLANTLSFTSSFIDLDYIYSPFNIQSLDTLDLDDGFSKGIDEDVASTNDDTTKDARVEDEEEKQEIFVSVENEDEDEDEAESNGESEKGEGEGGGGLLVADDEGENDVSINTEELNRKVEEFIRKMKEEIRIEANQHLIAV